MASMKLQRRPLLTGLLPSLSRDMDQFQSNIRRMFENPLAAEVLATTPQTIGWMPPVEISESGNEVTLTAELAGMDSKDVHVELDGDVLTLRGEKQAERKEGEPGTESSVYGAPSDPLPSDPEWAGHRVYLDIKERDCAAPAEDLWAIIEGIGGENGWYSLPIAWAARGFADKLVGGVGLRRGRSNPEKLRVGESVDWWRVERIDHGRFLRLRAEMKVPGLAWLELSAEPQPDGTSRYLQRAIFFPRGLGGRLYWLSILPAHGIIFNGMADKITAAAVKRYQERTAQ